MAISDTKPRNQQPSSKASKIYRLTNNNVSKAAIEIELILGSRYAQNVYNRSFKKANESCYRLSVVLPEIMQSDRADEVNEVVDQLFSAAEKNLNDAYGQMEEFSKQQGISTVANYTNPKRYTPELNAPRSRAYIALIQKLEKIAQTADMLWLSGAIDEKQLRTSLMSLSKELFQLSQKVYEITLRATRAVSQNDKKTSKSKKADETVEATVEEENEISQIAG